MTNSYRRKEELELQLRYLKSCLDNGIFYDLFEDKTGKEYLQEQITKMKTELDLLNEYITSANNIALKYNDESVKILDLSMKGYTYDQIADTLLISRSTVARKLKEMREQLP